MSDKLKIATVGVEEKYTRFFQQILKLHTGKLKKDWLYVGDLEPQQVVATMGSQVNDADVLFIDIDNEHGRRAWYTLQVLFDEHGMVALTIDLQHSGARLSLQKSVLNWAAGQGTEVVDILNAFSSTTK
jgi:hypothetical protein